jgi:hypothetical protein
MGRKEGLGKAPRWGRRMRDTGNRTPTASTGAWERRCAEIAHAETTPVESSSRRPLSPHLPRSVGRWARERGNTCSDSRRGGHARGHCARPDADL